MASVALAVIMGVLTLVWPAATGLEPRRSLPGPSSAGIADIIGAFLGGISGGRRIWLMIIGLLGIAVVGIYFFVHTVTGVLALLWVVGVYMVALGILRIIAEFIQPPRPQAA